MNNTARLTFNRNCYDGGGYTKGDTLLAEWEFCNDKIRCWPLTTEKGRVFDVPVDAVLVQPLAVYPATVKFLMEVNSRGRANEAAYTIPAGTELTADVADDGSSTVDLVLELTAKPNWLCRIPKVALEINPASL